MEEKQYKVDVRKDVVKALRRFPKDARRKIMQAMENLAATPRPRGCKKLEEDIYRLRVGRDYRVIYSVDDKEGRIQVTNVFAREKGY